MTADLEQQEENHGDEADAWRVRADELADWAWPVLVNRHDIHGGQRLDPSGGFKRTVWWGGLTWGLLHRHFAAESTLDVIGLHCTAPDETCRWIGVDIDAHDGQGACPEANLRFALHVHIRALKAGLAARLVDSSGGRGGYHLWVVFGNPAPMAVARRLALWLARDWAAFGLTRRPDLFPGNHMLTGKRCGTWLRLPGRHHKRPSWARVWSPSRRGWRVGDEAIDALLSLAGRSVDPASIVTPDFEPIGPKPVGGSRRPKASISSIVRPAPLRARSPGTNRQGGTALPARDFRQAVSALRSYPNQGLDYDDWLAIGMALRNLEDEEAAFRLWDDWSSESIKYDPEATAAKWESLRPADESGGIGLGTLYKKAIERGWSGPAFLVSVDARGLSRATHRSGRRGTIVIPGRAAKAQTVAVNSPSKSDPDPGDQAVEVVVDEDMQARRSSTKIPPKGASSHE